MQRLGMEQGVQLKLKMVSKSASLRLQKSVEGPQLRVAQTPAQTGQTS